MSLTIIKEAEPDHKGLVSNLSPGTWFIERDGQIYIIVHDDAMQMRRVMCAGNFYHPFMVDIPIEKLEVIKILEPGTVLQITTPAEQGGRHV